MGFSETGGLRVVDVGPGPAREVGLTVDDRVLAIDDEPVRDLSLREIVEALRGRPGTKVKLTIDRAGQVIELEVERETYRRPRQR